MTESGGGVTVAAGMLTAEPAWAWVRPSFSPLAAGTGPSAADASGIAGEPAQFTCGGWKETSPFTGLAVDSTGAFDLMDCGTAQPVACCAPVPEAPAP